MRRGYIPCGCQATPQSARPMEDLSKSNYLEFLAFNLLHKTHTSIKLSKLEFEFSN